MKKLSLYFLLNIVFTICINAQTGELPELIRQLQTKHQVIFSYDVELIKGVPAQVDSTEKDIRKIVQQLNTNTAFHFEFLNTKNIIVKPKYGSLNFLLRGAVFDKKTKEALLGTLIFQSHGRYGISAGEDGSFSKAIHYDANDSIIISCMGYEKQTLPLSAFASAFKRIELEAQRIQMNEVAVTAYLTTGVNYDALDNSINIRPRNLTLLPGNVNGDVLSSLDALPGISSPDGKAGNLNIRGSTPDQTQVSVDEIPVYMKGHYFGTISPINPNAVQDIKVQRSIMSVNKGGRAGGLVEIHTPNAVSNKLSGIVSASAIDANAYLHVPLIKDRLSIAASGRHSYPYNAANPSLKPISNFVFQETGIQSLLDGTSKEKLLKLGFNYSDANIKANYYISQKHKGSLSYLYIENNMLVEKNSRQMNTSQGDIIKLFNWGVNSSLYSNWTSKFNTFLSLTHTTYNQTFTLRKTNFRLDSTKTRSFFQNIAEDSRLLFETDAKLSATFNLKTGYDGRLQKISYEKKTTDSSNTSYGQNFNNTGTVHSVYTTLSGLIEEKLIVNLGLRANYFTVTGKYSFEPRIFLNYALSNHFRLKTSAGYQKQFVTQISGVSIESIGGLENQIWMLANDQDVPVINSTQATFGGMYDKNSWLIDVEGYYRVVQNISSISLTAPLAEHPFIHGDVNSMGLDVLIRKQWKNFDSWVSYSYGDSKMKFDSINSGKSFTSIYDQTHILDLAGSYRIGQWKFTLAWKYRTGLASLPDIRTRMLSGAPTGGTQQQQPPPPPGGGGPPPSGTPPLPQGLYTGRFPDYHQLDASVYYSFPKDVKRVKGTVGASVTNCYNQKNIIEQVPNGNKVQNRYMPGLSPNIFFTVSF